MSEILLLCAENPNKLKERVDELIPRVARLSPEELFDLAKGLPGSNLTTKHRLGIVSESPERLAETLRRVSEKLSQGANTEDLDDSMNCIFAAKALENPELAMLFPGHGAQRLNMGKYFFAHYTFVREFYERVDKALEKLIPEGLSSHIFYDSQSGSEAAFKSQQSKLGHTTVAQPAIVLSSVAMLAVLDFLGLKPNIAIGHSLGEISAIHAAGACDDLTAVWIAALRGKAMGSVQVEDRGGMAVIGANQREVQRLIEPFGSSLVISNYNSPRQTVVSGTSSAIRALFGVCRKNKFLYGKLPVSHAFHSNIVAPAVSVFRKSLKDIPIHGLSQTVISTSTGREIARSTDLRELLVDEIRRPVRFIEAVLKAHQHQPSMWIEVGPGDILSRLVKEILNTNRIDCLSTDLKDEDSSLLLHKIVSRAYVLGFPLALDRIFNGLGHGAGGREQRKEKYGEAGKK